MGVIGVNPNKNMSSLAEIRAVANGNIGIANN